MDKELTAFQRGAEKSSANWTNHPMLNLHPTHLEVQAAKAVFLQELRRFEPYTRLPVGSAGYTSPETAVACALAEVWRQGRKYQRGQTTANCGSWW